MDDTLNFKTPSTAKECKMEGICVTLEETKTVQMWWRPSRSFALLWILFIFWKAATVALYKSIMKGKLSVSHQTDFPTHILSHGIPRAKITKPTTRSDTLDTNSKKLNLIRPLCPLAFSWAETCWGGGDRIRDLLNRAPWLLHRRGGLGGGAVWRSPAFAPYPPPTPSTVKNHQTQAQT